MKGSVKTAGKTAQTNEVSLSINEVAELYKGAAEQAKELDDKLKKYKEQLIQYGNDHQDEWTKDGLAFSNGVRLIKKVTMKQFFDEDEIDTDWLEDFIELSSGSCVKIGFDQKKVQKAAEDCEQLKAHLAKIDYNVEPVESVAVLLK